MSLKEKLLTIVNMDWAANRGNRDLIRKIMMLFIVLVFSLVFLPGVVSAHPPKKVTLTYDAAAKVLKVTILHPSFAPSWHYIKTVAVAKNKQALASYPYTSQPGDEFTYTYEIPVAPGDTLVVTASCSMYGTRTESLTIPAAKN